MGIFQKYYIPPRVRSYGQNHLLDLSISIKISLIIHGFFTKIFYILSFLEFLIYFKLTIFLSIFLLLLAARLLFCCLIVRCLAAPLFLIRIVLPLRCDSSLLIFLFWVWASAGACGLMWEISRWVKRNSLCLSRTNFDKIYANEQSIAVYIVEFKLSCDVTVNFFIENIS